MEVIEMDYLKGGKPEWLIPGEELVLCGWCLSQIWKKLENILLVLLILILAILNGKRFRSLIA